MNKKTQQLNRLYEAAARAVMPVEPLSYRTEEVAIAAWKQGGLVEEELWESSLFTPALATGFGLVLVSLIVTYLTPVLSNVSDLELPLIALNRLCSL